jgi:hypothetical protein
MSDVHGCSDPAPVYVGFKRGPLLSPLRTSLVAFAALNPTERSGVRSRLPPLARPGDCRASPRSAARRGVMATATPVQTVSRVVRFDEHPGSTRSPFITSAHRGSSAKRARMPKNKRSQFAHCKSFSNRARHLRKAKGFGRSRSQKEPAHSFPAKPFKLRLSRGPRLAVILPSQPRRSLIRFRPQQTLCERT